MNWPVVKVMPALSELEAVPTRLETESVKPAVWPSEMLPLVALLKRQTLTAPVIPAG